MARRLQEQKGRTCSIPLLKKGDGRWSTNPKTKTDQLAETFQAKCKMAAKVWNAYSKIERASCRGQSAILLPTEKQAVHCLAELSCDIGTGPDVLPARILKICAQELAKRVCMLAHRILEEAR